MTPARAACLAALALATPAIGRAQEPSGSPRPAWVTATPPPGWSENPALARSVAKGLEQSHSFGDARGQAGGTAHVQPGTGAFYVSWLEAAEPAPAPIAAVRTAFDRLRESRLSASPEARSTEELRYGESVADGVAQATLEWRHVSNETTTMVRALAWATRDGKPRLVRAECVLGTEGGAAPAAASEACRRALASLAVAAPAAERAALPPLPAAVAGAADGERFGLGEEEGATGPAAESAGVPPATVGPAVSGAEDRILYRGRPPAEESGWGGRWILLVGAALVIAGALLTVRSRARSRSAAAAPDAAPVEVAPVDRAGPGTDDSTTEDPEEKAP